MARSGRLRCSDGLSPFSARDAFLASLSGRVPSQRLSPVSRARLTADYADGGRIFAATAALGLTNHPTKHVGKYRQRCHELRPELRRQLRQQLNPALNLNLNLDLNPPLDRVLSAKSFEELYQKSPAALLASFSQRKYPQLREPVHRALCRRLRLPRRSPGRGWAAELWWRARPIPYVVVTGLVLISSTLK